MSVWVLLHRTVISSGVPIKDRDRYIIEVVAHIYIPKLYLCHADVKTHLFGISQCSRFHFMSKDASLVTMQSLLTTAETSIKYSRMLE